MRCNAVIVEANRNHHWGDIVDFLPLLFIILLVDRVNLIKITKSVSFKLLSIEFPLRVLSAKEKTEQFMQVVLNITVFSISYETCH